MKFLNFGLALGIFDVKINIIRISGFKQCLQKTEITFVIELIMRLAECLVGQFAFVRYDKCPEMQVRIIEKEVYQCKIKINTRRGNLIPLHLKFGA